MRRLIPALIVLVLAAGGAFAWWRTQDEAGQAGFRFAAVTRGPIQMTVSSSGKVNPVITVEVGSQVSGQIGELLADFNTEVAADQVIARIDPASFEARVRVARAEVAVAQAGVAVARATLAQLEADIAGERAALKDAEQDLARKQTLFDRRVVAKSEVDKAIAQRDQAAAKLNSAVARLRMQRAQVQTAQAQVQAKEATLVDRELDLENTVIRSPVDGVVIGRNVDVGQTVAASLQAPVLFTIAQDLTRMQVEVSIDEADIGRIRESQAVKFTVDAYPQREFSGAVRQIRKAPVEVSNVVTYTVIVDADNPDQALLPGMTANVEVIVGAREAVLKVANAALRFRPAGASPAATGNRAGGPQAARQRGDALIERLTRSLQLSEAQQGEIRALFAATGQRLRTLRDSGAEAMQIRAAAQQMRAQNGHHIEALLDDEQRRKYRLMQAENTAVGSRQGQVWVVGADGQPQAIDVVVGLTDGSATEIVGGPLTEGDPVITGVSVTSR